MKSTRRDDLFAHNDETDLRDVVDVWAMLGIGAGRFVEQHRTIRAEVLPSIARLARQQGRKFSHRLDEVEVELGRARDDGSMW